MRKRNHVDLFDIALRCGDNKCTEKKKGKRDSERDSKRERERERDLHGGSFKQINESL